MKEFECHYCGQPVDPHSHMTYRRVVAWGRIAGTRSTGTKGGSDIRLRRYTDDYACSPCIDRQKTGISPWQGSLL